MFYFDHLDEGVHDHFLEMDRQKVDRSKILTDNYHIYLINAYTVHEATAARQTGFRTFLRISFDVKEFDRLGNTINPLFDYKRDMTPREVQSGLIRYSPLSEAQLTAIEDSEKGIVCIVVSSIRSVCGPIRYSFI